MGRCRLGASQYFVLPNQSCIVKTKLNVDIIHKDIVGDTPMKYFSNAYLQQWTHGWCQKSIWEIRSFASCSTL